MGEMTKAKGLAEVEKLIVDTVAKVAKQKTCEKCVFSYLNRDGYGFCKYQRGTIKSMHPRPITASDTCNHWKAK